MSGRLRGVHSWTLDGTRLTLWLILTDGSLVAADLDVDELMAEAYPVEATGVESPN